MADQDERFRALFVTRGEDKQQTVETVELSPDDLMEGDVLLRVTHSTVNYKDGLALTGKMPVIRRWPMIPGIDLAGEVVASDHPDWRPGDPVILNGWGLGETHYGGYAGMARVSGDWLIRRPEGLSAADSMAVGTAGYTAMLAILALERHAILPDRGPVIVTGAAGGVGSMAIALLSQLGYQAVASTGRMSEADYLKGLGAAEVIDRAELAGPAKPLASERWAGGIDAVGSHTLANVLSMTKYGGAVAACGNAGGMDLPTSVAPFILRAVSLFGIGSVQAPKALREEAWGRIARHLDRGKLAAMTTEVGFDAIPDKAREITEAKVRGRLVVEMAG